MIDPVFKPLVYRTRAGLCALSAQSPPSKRHSSYMLQAPNTFQAMSTDDTSSPPQVIRLGSRDVLMIQVALMEIAVDLVFYGVQTGLFIAAVSALAHQDNRSRLVTVAVVLLFVSSTSEVALEILFYVVQAPMILATDLGGVYDLLFRLYLATEICFRFNFIMSDAIVIWRAWVLWRDNRIVKGILSLCMAGSLVLPIVECVFWVRDAMGEPVPHLMSLMVTTPLLVTNSVTTILVGFQVWYYRRNIKGAIGPWKRSTQVEKVLVLLLESGFAYCLIWAVRLALDVAQSAGRIAIPYAIITIAYHSTAGIYPTLIILVVAMQRSATQDLALSQEISLPVMEGEALVFQSKSVPSRSVDETHSEWPSQSSVMPDDIREARSSTSGEESSSYDAIASEPKPVVESAETS
ncbi:hypothetical protein EV122DRAFT_294876 [Schizophyllum commune]